MYPSSLSIKMMRTPNCIQSKSAIAYRIQELKSALKLCWYSKTIAANKITTPPNASI